jgi:hypothetical protein
VCEPCVCMFTGTSIIRSIVVMSHCDIHHECEGRDPIIFSTWQDDIILDLDVTPFIGEVEIRPRQTGPDCERDKVYVDYTDYAL